MNDFIQAEPSFYAMGHGHGYESKYCFSEQMNQPQYHCHDFFEFYLHLQGGEYMGVDEKLFALKPRQLFIFPPFSMHGLISRDHLLHQYERAYMNISSDVLQQLGCKQIDLEAFLIAHVSGGNYTYQLSEEDSALFVSCARSLQDCSEPLDPITRFQHYALMVNFLNHLCQLLNRIQPEESESSSGNIIQNVLAYINQHYTESLSIRSLAAHFNISPSYLAHEFSRFTHRSLYNYILYRRIMLSLQQMMGDASLNAIAFQCGFSDYSNFLRSFTRLMGISPSQYRKRLRAYPIEQPSHQSS